jgi:hypothetical protein
MTYVVVVTANGIEERDVDTSEGTPFVDDLVGYPSTFYGAWDSNLFMLGCRDQPEGAPAVPDVLLPAPSFRRDAGPFTGPLVFVRMDVACNPVDYRAADYERLRSEGHAAVDDDANE